MPKIPVGNTFLKRRSSHALLDRLPPVGQQHKADADADPTQPRLFYSHPNGTLWVGDCIRWLESLQTASVDLIFADPPYNIGKADWDEFDSHDNYIEWSLRWIEQASRVLKPHGSLYMCGFSEILADVRRSSGEVFRGLQVAGLVL